MIDRTEPSFLVQALDNVGEDLTAIAGWLDFRGDSHRDAVIRLRESINEVGLRATEHSLRTTGARLRVYRGRFNLEVDLDVRDAANRRVAVLCHAGVPRRGDSEWPSAMSRRLDVFLTRHELPEPLQAEQAFAETEVLTTTTRIGRACRALLDKLLSLLGLSTLRTEKKTTMPPKVPDPVAGHRLLVFVGAGRRDGLRASRDGQALLRDRSAEVIEHPLAPDLLERSPILRRLDRDGAVEHGAVLMLHPHNTDRYISLRDFSDEVALSKIRITTDLCRRLGASLVSVEEATVDSAAGQSKWSAGAANEMTEGKVEWLNSHLEELMRSVNTHDTFAGGSPNIDSARKLLRDHGLDEDEEFLELIALREGENLLRSRVIQVVTRSEVAKAQGLAAKLRVALPSVGVEVESSSRELRTYFFKLTIEFPASP